MEANAFIDDAIEEIRQKVGNGRALIALSGGVDSSACAILAHLALGDRLIPVYVDTGLMRKGETDRIREAFSFMNPRVIDAGDRFFDALRGISDPEKKRKIVGETFIRVFESVVRGLDVDYLIQGTIYPDRIESEGGIKSHHNVGGLPSVTEFKGIIEPLQDLYKDEVREVARDIVSNGIETAADVVGVVADQRAGDDVFLPGIQAVDLGDAQIELVVQARQERLDTAAFFLERGAAG